MICKNCGCSIDDNAYFCVHCGAIVKRDAGKRQMRFCVYCGKPVDPNAVMCVHCGKDLTGVIVTQKRKTSYLLGMIFSIILSLVAMPFGGAVLAIVDLFQACKEDDRRGKQLSLIAMLVSVVSAITIIVLYFFGLM